MVLPFISKVGHVPEIMLGAVLFTAGWVWLQGRKARPVAARTTGSTDYQRFIASMQIDYARWHDGEPYDLDALARLTGDERDRIETLLIARRDNDWRDVDALDRLGSPAALAALEESARGPNREVRIRASEHLFDRGRRTDLDEVLVDGIRHATFGQGLQETLWLAAKHPTPAVIRALAEAALCRREEGAVHAVALLYFLHGLAAEEFDTAHQDYFLRFRTTPHGPQRRALFDELCAKIGIDGSGIDCPPQPAS
jgi:hypothetical protein